MELAEPGELTKVGALSGGLEVKVLAGIIFLWGGSKGDLVVFIVVFNNVVDNGARFPERDTGVGVIDGRDAEGELTQLEAERFGVMDV